MADTSLPFYQIQTLSPPTIVATNIWDRSEAMGTAKTLAKKDKVKLVVYKLQLVMSDESEEASIVF